MSAKRSRISRSSSLGDACSFNQTQPFDPPVPRREKPPMILHSVNVSSSPVPKPEPPPRRNIFTLGPPCHYPIDKSKSSRSFLESCHRCNKKFSEKDDIFIYSYLCAFCSPECRDIQIAMDKQLEQSKTNTAKMERGDTQFGARSRNGVVSGVRS